MTESKDLKKELERVKEQGYSQDRGEIEPDLFCIAIAIRDFDGKVRSAISISQRIHPATGELAHSLDKVLSALRSAADDIEVKLGLPMQSGELQD